MLTLKRAYAIALSSVASRSGRHLGLHIKVLLVVNRLCGLTPDPFDLRAFQPLVCETIQAQHLVIGKIKCPLHTLETPVYWVITIASAWLAPDKVCHEWPPLIPKPWMVVLHHLLVLVHQPSPETVQVV